MFFYLVIFFCSFIMEPHEKKIDWNKPLAEEELPFHAEHFGDLLFDETDIPLDNNKLMKNMLMKVTMNM